MNKTSKGGYADYSTSNWARRERPLTDAEMQAINTHGLFNFSDFLPKKPDEVAVKVMKEMFEASVDGEAYDSEKWGNYFRPAGMAARTGDPNKAASPNATAVSQSAPEAQVETPKVDTTPKQEEAPKVEEPKAETASTGDAADILAMIRQRQAK